MTTAAERETARQIAQFDQAYLDTRSNVMRWKSNDQCPMRDMLDAWQDAELIGYTVASNTIQVREIESAAAIRAYAAHRAQHGYNAEELAEMRAAFGPGHVVVDALTGIRTQL